MLAAAFVGQGIDSLRSPKSAADAAQPALEGLQKLPDPLGSRVPMDAETFAKVTAAVQIAGGLLLASGRIPRVASAALAATVVPANLGTRMFWNEVDPELKAAKRRDFLTDVSLLGGLVIASADTAGKPSLGWRGRRAAARFGETVASALPSAADSDLADRVGQRLHEGLNVAAEKGAPLLEAARDRGAAAAEKAVPLLEAARERGAELAHAALEQGDELAHDARRKARAWRN